MQYVCISEFLAGFFTIFNTRKCIDTATFAEEIDSFPHWDEVRAESFGYLHFKPGDIIEDTGLKDHKFGPIYRIVKKESITYVPDWCYQYHGFKEDYECDYFHFRYASWSRSVYPVRWFMSMDTKKVPLDLKIFLKETKYPLPFNTVRGTIGENTVSLDTTWLYVSDLRMQEMPEMITVAVRDMCKAYFTTPVRVERLSHRCLRMNSDRVSTNVVLSITKVE